MHFSTFRHSRRGYAGRLLLVLALLALTTLALLLFQSELTSPIIALLYLVPVGVAASLGGLGFGILASFVAFLTFNYLFIPPYYTLAVADLRHFVTFAMMFFVAVVISGLTKRVRDQAESAREREVRTASLYALSRALTASKTRREVLLAGTKQNQELFGGRVAALVLSPSGALVSSVDGAWTYETDEKERGVADLVWQSGRPAGLGTD